MCPWRAAHVLGALAQASRLLPASRGWELPELRQAGPWDYTHHEVPLRRAPPRPRLSGQQALVGASSPRRAAHRGGPCS